MAINFERANARELMQGLVRRDVSAVELCDAAIARIEAANGAVNAVVVKDFERARDAARAADAARAKGDERALLGLPMTVKESFDVAGLPTTWGIAELAEYRPEVDAVAVARLKAAGAVILGKTNVPPSLGDWQTANSIYGRTNHPLDPARTPGGSSGGSAAAVASFMVPLELGSDIGGSIRVPAHFCGLFGHKPSLGMLPARDHKPPRMDGAPSVLSVIGPLARSAADLVLAFDVLAGVDPADAVGLRIEAPGARIASLRDARVLVIDAHPAAAADSDTRGAIEALAGELARGGARVARRSELLPDLEHGHAVYSKLLRTEVDRRRPNTGPSISAWDWLALLDERHRIRRRWAALFQEVDAVIAPVFGTPAFIQFGNEPFVERTLTIDGVATRYGDQIAWSGIATLPGLPATAVPVATSRDGLPIGVQVIGPWLEDRTPLAIAAAIEQLRQ